MICWNMSLNSANERVSLDSGLGRHMWLMSDEDRKNALKNEFTSQPLGMWHS